MEIVRQRKKRLLAWILTLVLCVGMWQGNVMASETSSYSVNYRESDNGSPMNVTYKINDESPMQLGEVINLSKTTDSVTLIGTTLGKLSTDTYTHSIISWDVEMSGEKLEQIKGTGNTIAPNDNWSWADSNVGWNNLTVVWEKIMVIIAGTKTTAYYESECTNNNEDGFKYEIINLPSIDQMSDAELYKDGYFFSEWAQEGSGIGEEGKVEIYYPDFGTIYKEIEFEKIYSTKIPRAGSFALVEDNYSLSEDYSEWTVNSDGYIYAGGIKFYSPGETYVFGVK